MYSHYLRLGALHCVQSQAYTDHSFQVRGQNNHIFKARGQSHLILYRLPFYYFPDDPVLIVWCADKNSGIGIEKGGG